MSINVFYNGKWTECENILTKSRRWSATKFTSVYRNEAWCAVHTRDDPRYSDSLIEKCVCSIRRIGISASRDIPEEDLQNEAIVKELVSVGINNYLPTTRLDINILNQGLDGRARLFLDYTLYPVTSEGCAYPCSRFLSPSLIVKHASRRLEINYGNSNYGDPRDIIPQEIFSGRIDDGFMRYYRCFIDLNEESYYPSDELKYTLDFDGAYYGIGDIIIPTQYIISENLKFGKLNMPT